MNGVLDKRADIIRLKYVDTYWDPNHCLNEEADAEDRIVPFEVVVIVQRAIGDPEHVSISVMIKWPTWVWSEVENNICYEASHFNIYLINLLVVSSAQAS